MPSFKHKKLVEQIAAIDVPPSDPKAFATWIEAGDHLRLLRDNARDDELVIYGAGEYTFIHSLVVPNDRLSPVNQDDLLGWSCNPYTTTASYTWGGGRDDVWIERGVGHAGSTILEAGLNLVFGRTFDGWSGSERSYFEVNQEYTHLAGIHWRSEHRAYCRYDDNGDLDHIVSVSMKSGADSNVALVSFKWGPLEEYLAASNSSIVRMFDFTLLRRENFVSWPDGPEEAIRQTDEFFYRRKVITGHAAYTRGVQIIRLRRSLPTVFASMRGRTAGGDEQYVELIAYDWRNKVVRKVSTDPRATTNYFEASKNKLPFELSPTFFRPEVLLKYKGDRDKYTVSDREISCRAGWHLKGIDVNEAGQVQAYICDLRMLPHTEQLHWLSYNEPPKSGISRRAVENDFEGKFSSQPDPVWNVLSVIHRWHEQRVAWWKLREEVLIDRISTPHTASRDEWGDAFMDLAKLVVEGFELKTIRLKLDAVGVAYDAKEQSIALLEKLRNHGADPAGTQALTGLRTVQFLRTKLKGHAGGSEAEQIARDALAKHETFAKHFRHVCEQVAEELTAIQALFR